MTEIKTFNITNRSKLGDLVVLDMVRQILTAGSDCLEKNRKKGGCFVFEAVAVKALVAGTEDGAPADTLWIGFVDMEVEK